MVNYVAILVRIVVVGFDSPVCDNTRFCDETRLVRILLDPLKGDLFSRMAPAFGLKYSTCFDSPATYLLELKLAFAR